MSDPVRLDTRSPSTRAARRRLSARVTVRLPTLEEAAKRLAAFRVQSLPWLAPASLEAAKEMPEVHGPKVYQKP